jgi:hypothetical protein
MSAEDRRKWIREGDSIVVAATVDDDIPALGSRLAELANQIADDFEEQRDAFGEAAGLLEQWEENHGWQQDAWQQAADELEYTEADATLEWVVETWESGSNQ